MKYSDTMVLKYASRIFELAKLWRDGDLSMDREEVFKEFYLTLLEMAAEIISSKEEEKEDDA